MFAAAVSRAVGMFGLCLSVAVMSAPVQHQVEAYAIRPISPLPEVDSTLVAMGRELFADPRLSSNDSVACISCHPLHRGGADGLDRSIGVDGRVGVINAPTVFNAVFNVGQFWDGRAATLAEQVDGPVHNPVEMNGDWPTIVAKLRRDTALRTAFETRFSDGLTAANISLAIAEYEKTLVTPDGLFDQFLAGNTQALSSQQLLGWQLFNDYGCISCHQGTNVGGNMYERMGIFVDYFAERGNITQQDYGRYNVTADPEDRFEFKVPGLRNVALTAPYFHDASAKDLESAVTVMARVQLGRQLTDHETAAIVSFLETLTGVYREFTE